MRDDNSNLPTENIFSPMRLFEDFFRGTPSGISALPNVDVEETEKEFVISVDLPGVGKEDIKLEVNDDRLTIEAERRSSQKSAQGSQKSYSSFRRTFILPTGTDPESVSADCDNGVLTIHVPRSEARKPRRIELGSSKKAEAKH